MANFSFNVVWQPGKSHAIADALSRAPVFAPREEDEDDADVSIRAITETNPNLVLIKDAATKDDNYLSILKAVKK